MTYKDEIDNLFTNVKFDVAHLCGAVSKLNECHQRTLEIVAELEDHRSTAWKASNAQYAMIAKAQDEARELRTKLESKNKTLGLVVQALAETIGEEER